MKVVILIVVGLILFISLLGLRGLCEPDEGRYAEIAREMIESGDFLTPRLNYIKHFHKPPLAYWLVAGSFLFFGMNEFTARIPVAVLGVCGLIITYFLSIRMGRDRVSSFFSGLILATTLQYFSWTQVLSSDMIFSFFILLAFYGFWTGSYIFYIAIALSFMVKGPVAVIIPALVVGVYALISKEKVFKKAQFLTGLFLFLAIVSPWFIYVCIKNQGLFKYFVFFQSLDRLFTNVHGRIGNLFYFIPIVIIGGLPWIVFTPWAIRIKDKANLFLLLWILVPVIFFSFSGSKLPGYILPVYPAIAIFVGTYTREKRFYSLFRILCIISGVIYLTGAFIISQIEGRLGNNLSIRRPAGVIREYGSPDDKVANFRCFLQGLPFYLKKRVILIERSRETQFEEDMDRHRDYLISNIKDFFNTLKKDERIWIFTKDVDYPDLMNSSPFPLYSVWKSSGYILVSNQKP